MPYDVSTIRGIQDVQNLEDVLVLSELSKRYNVNTKQPRQKFDRELWTKIEAERKAASQPKTALEWVNTLWPDWMDRLVAKLPEPVKLALQDWMSRISPLEFVGLAITAKLTQMVIGDREKAVKMVDDMPKAQTVVEIPVETTEPELTAEQKRIKELEAQLAAKNVTVVETPVETTEPELTAEQKRIKELEAQLAAKDTNPDEGVWGLTRLFEGIVGGPKKS